MSIKIKKMARNLIDMLNRVGLGLAIAGVTGLGIFIGEYPARNYLNKKVPLPQ